MPTDEERPLQPHESAGVIGYCLYHISERFKANGIETGDVLCSSSVTREVNTAEKFARACQSADGTDLRLIRNGKRFKVILGQGITEKEE